jgi:hypothetical protein
MHATFKTDTTTYAPDVHVHVCMHGLLRHDSFSSSPCSYTTIVCILKAHLHSKSEGSIWASLECQCCFWIAGGLVPYLTMWLLTLQLFKNSTDTQGKLRLNLHSLSMSMSELLEYRRVSLRHCHVVMHVCNTVNCNNVNFEYDCHVKHTWYWLHLREHYSIYL